MTELMKRYEAETGEIATWIWHNKELVTDDVLDWVWGKMQTLEAKNAQLKSHISTIEEQLWDTIEEVYALKDQLRWRPVSEKPEKTNRYWCEFNFILSEGTYYNIGAYHADSDRWEHFNNESGRMVVVNDPPIRWTHLPIPPAPEGEAK